MVTRDARLYPLSARTLGWEGGEQPPRELADLRVHDGGVRHLPSATGGLSPVDPDLRPDVRESVLAREHGADLGSAPAREAERDEHPRLQVAVPVPAVEPDCRAVEHAATLPLPRVPRGPGRRPARASGGAGVGWRWR